MKTGQDNGGLADSEITGLTTNLEKLKKVCAHTVVYIFSGYMYAVLGVTRCVILLLFGVTE